MGLSAIDAATVSRHSPRLRRALNVRAGLPRPRHPALLMAFPTLILCAGAWALLAPPQMAGSTSYVITDGVSMLPNFHAGDLVLLRRQAQYQVGEVAGYRNPQLGVTVMHRIVAVQGDRYLFKGDNNSWIDTDEPTAAQIVGAEWVHLAGWGNALLHLRAPGFAAVILGLLWLFVFWPRSGSRRQRRRRHHAQ